MTWRARASITLAWAAAVFSGTALAGVQNEAEARAWHSVYGAQRAILKDSYRLETIQCYGFGKDRLGGRLFRRFECSAVSGRTWYTFGVYFATNRIHYHPHDFGSIG